MIEHMRQRTKNVMLWSGIAAGGYFVLYFSSVQAVTYKSTGPVIPKPIYSWPSDGDFTHAVFAPAHLMDTVVLRRSYWAPIQPPTSPNPY